MASSDSIRRRALRTGRVWADALAYAGVVTALVAVAAMAIGVATGGGFVRGNVVLFVAGWALLAYATVRLWPTSPDDLEESAAPVAGPSGSPSRIQRIAREVPPARWTRPPAREDRIGSAGKLFVSSLLVLCLSFVLETVFGVA